MLPYVTIGQFKLSLYYTAMVLGYVFMAVLMLLKSRRAKYGMSRPRAVLFATLELIFGILGCKILYVLECIELVKEKGFTIGGFSFYGAVFLIPLMMPLFKKPLGLDLRSTLDNSAICIIAMLGTIRIGCYLNGCCGGRVFTLGDWSFSLPTQLIECACDFVILYFLLRSEKKGDAKGFLYPRFLLCYGVARFFIEFLRNTDKDWLGFSHAQWFSAAAVIIGAVCEVLLRKKKKAGEQE